MKSSLKAKVFLFCLFSLTLVLSYFFYTDSPKQYIPLLRQKLQEQTLQKNFLYLVQTEQCLSELLMQKEYLSNSSECHCDVIVYGYKGKCLDIQHKHIVYLYEPNSASTWNTGRNMLYKIGRDRNVSYLYYIFLDGDIKLEYNEKIASETMMSVSPMRSFEKFLIEREPGIGITDYPFNRGTVYMVQKMQQNCNLGAKTNVSNRTSTDSLYLTSIHFDALFNAFHRDIIDHILPYTLDYDDSDWQMSQRYLVSAIELKFRGQVVLFTPVTIYNTEHLGYPGEELLIFENWVKSVKQIVSTMPERYQDDESVKQHMESPNEYTDNSKTMCFIPPIQNRFKMYSHFELNWTV